MASSSSVAWFSSKTKRFGASQHVPTKILYTTGETFSSSFSFWLLFRSCVFSPPTYSLVSYPWFWVICLARENTWRSYPCSKTMTTPLVILHLIHVHMCTTCIMLPVVFFADHAKSRSSFPAGYPNCCTHRHANPLNLFGWFFVFRKNDFLKCCARERITKKTFLIVAHSNTNCFRVVETRDGGAYLNDLE